MHGPAARSLAGILAAWAAGTLLAQPATGEQDVTESLAFANGARTYRLFVPGGIDGRAPAPAVVLFNGSGSSVDPLFRFWKDLARREGIVLIGPTAFAPGAWRIPEDSPEFTGRSIEAVASRVPIDPRRVYLFGHSGGAGHVLLLGLLESEYFAGVAAHASAIRAEDARFLDVPKRKIPIAIWLGTKDALVPVAAARDTYDALLARDFPAKLTEMKGHTHNYAERGEEITRQAWDFLRRQRLDREPRFYLYQFNPKR
jgi:poly(3-hydroxybutyrate) depolymerase